MVIHGWGRIVPVVPAIKGRQCVENNNADLDTSPVLR